jgi:hypothetical protein
VSGICRPNDPHPPAALIFDTKARARFWSKVSPGPTDACWLWHGAVGASGYGNVARKVDGRSYTYLAHRVAYELANGAIPAGLDLDHLCRNKRCVNPAHLEAVTFLANMRRRYATTPDERETHCLQGHELTPENTAWVQSTGQRRCRECAQTRRREVS